MKSNHGLARRLIINADDFGRSAGINAAVIRAHREGILTSASLMVNEPGFDEAVTLARANPVLGIGLHLTLLCGHSTLEPQRIPGLVDQHRAFSSNPVGVGLRYFVSRLLRAQLEAEIDAQFDRFNRTGLKLDHVNGHLHLHLHPTVFSILMRRARDWNITHLRLTWDPFWFNTRLARGHWAYRGVHAALYHVLAGRARPVLRERAIRHTRVVFGLLQNARVDEDYVTRLLSVLPPGDSELYSHPSLDEFKNELDALVSPRVKRLVQEQGIQLVRYQDL
jgi:hopanoid biosynthesis associated protein HpnK